MRVTTGRLTTGLCALVLILASGCGAADAISEGISGTSVSQSPSRGVTSLQTAPFDDTGAPAHVTPAPAPAPDQPPQDPDYVPDFTTVAANFDPGKQRLIWVLPPGMHGTGPWGFDVTVRMKGEVKHETQLPLLAKVQPSGTQAEFPAGYEIIRLTDDGQWTARTAELDKVIQQLIAEHGRGNGELEFSSLLQVSLDAAARQKYCVEHKPADVRFYVEELGKSELIMLLDGVDQTFANFLLKPVCEAN